MFVSMFFLLFFGFTVLVNGEEVCSKTNCDVYRKTEGVQVTLGEWLDQESGDREAATNKVIGHFNASLTKVKGEVKSEITEVKNELKQILDIIQGGCPSTSTVTPDPNSNDTDIPTQRPVTNWPWLTTSVSTISPVNNITDCSDLPDYHGVLTLFNNKQVMCNKGWTSVMNVNLYDQLDVNRTWVEYENGFGNLERSHWTGLKLISNVMAKKEKWMLKYKLVSTRLSTSFGTYQNFTIDVNNKYRYHVGSFSGPYDNNYLDCNGNPYFNQNGMYFSTKDRNHDNWSRSCAKTNGAGFWYNTCGNLQHVHYSLGSVGYFKSCFGGVSADLERMSLEIKPY